MEGCLAAFHSSSTFFGLVFQTSSFILPQINNILILSLKNLDLLHLQKLHSGSWGVARCSIMLKNLIPLVIGNVMGGKDFLTFSAVNVAIHFTDFPSTSIPNVIPNHNFPTSKFYCLLGEPWVQMGTRGSLTVFAALGMELSWWFIWKIYFLPFFSCPAFLQTVGFRPLLQQNVWPGLYNLYKQIPAYECRILGNRTIFWYRKHSGL